MNTSALNKKYIYSIKCDCNNKECFIKNNKVKKFINKCRTTLNLDETKAIEKGNNILALVRSFEDRNYEIFNKKTKCDILKDYVFLNESFIRCSDINIGNKAHFELMLKKTDELYGECSKYRTITFKLLNDNKTGQDKINKLELNLIDKTNEIKRLKRQNKKLEMLLSNMKFKENTSEPSEASDTSDTETSEASDTSDTETSEPDFYNSSHPNILRIYERVKKYMISKNTSLTTLCRVNNRNTVLFRKQFLKLQLMRLNIAHPEIDPIQSDSEFFNDLMI